MNDNQVLYYKKRASEYENIYKKPERQDDINFLKRWLSNYFKGKLVNEVACGTGYWTQYISENAKCISASDINSTVLDIAKEKQYNAPVEFVQEDLFKQISHSEKYDAVFAGFIWSHIAKFNLSVFLQRLSDRLHDGGNIVIIDNCYVKGSNYPLHSEDEEGNFYQLRTLEDGSKHKVMKNFPTDKELINTIKHIATEIEIERLKYYWILHFKLKKS